MKKLAALLMVLVLLLCAAAQAETKVINLSDAADEYFHSGLNGLLIPVDGDTVFTGETDMMVYVQHKSGVITLDNVLIDGGDKSMLAIASDASMVEVKLKGLNRVFGGSNLGAMLCMASLKFTDGGDGALLASGLVGMQVRGDIIVDGGKITAYGNSGNSYAGIFTLDGTLTVNGGRMSAMCAGSDENEITGAYLNVEELTENPDEDLGNVPFEPGKIIAGEDYIIKVGDSPLSLSETGAYNGEACLEIAKPELPETGDGANLVLWTLMLAASVIGVLSMRRKAY